jgi:hypothetical protein
MASRRSKRRAIIVGWQERMMPYATANDGTEIIHGKEDQAVPIAASGGATHTLIPHSESRRYAGPLHALTTTHRDQYNTDLPAFVS